MDGEVQVLKLGGSLLTDKAADLPTFFYQNAFRIAKEIASLSEFPVLVHGTGSFGKPAARQYGYMEGFLSRKRLHVVSAVSQILETLRCHVLDVFRKEGVPAVGLSAGSLFKMADGVIVACHGDPVLGFVRRGMLPVISGDFVLDDRRDFAVCSSDLMASQLAIALKARRLVFATDVSGVLGPEGQSGGVLSAVSENDEDLWKAACSGHDDITQSMKGKLRAGFQAANRGVETVIVDGRIPGRICDILSNKPTISTRLLPAALRH